MMLGDRPEEQQTLYKEILFKKLTVREAEAIARHIAHDKVRKKLPPDPEMERIERELAESLGTRVSIERRQVGGGKLVIDFFSSDDLRVLLDKVHLHDHLNVVRSLREQSESGATANEEGILESSTPIAISSPTLPPETLVEEMMPDEFLHTPYDDRPQEEQKHDANNSDAEDPKLYSISNFSI